MEAHWTPAQTSEAEKWLVEAVSLSSVISALVPPIECQFLFQMLGYRKALRTASPSTPSGHSQSIAAPERDLQPTETGRTLSRTASSSSLLTDSIRSVTHPNALAAASQRQGFDFLEDIRRTILKDMPPNSHAPSATGSSLSPSSSSTPPEETQEARERRLDAEDLAAVNEEIERYYAQGPLEQHKYNPLLYWEVRL